MNRSELPHPLSKIRDPEELEGRKKASAISMLTEAFDHYEMRGYWPRDISMVTIPPADILDPGERADPAMHYVLYTTTGWTDGGELHLLARITSPESPAYPLDIVKAARAACINPDVAYSRQDDAYDDDLLRGLLQLDRENREYDGTVEPHGLSFFNIVAWVQPVHVSGSIQ